MNKVVTRIQLVDGDALGYLDVKEDSNFPINYKIGDIRDLSSRSGSFSKTIKLAGTKNNNLLLNNYFDVNIKSGNFDVNKRQKCIVIQNDVVVLDNAYLRLLRVIKKQATGEQIDDYVEYEVQVRDSLGDFFKEINNKELTELGGWGIFDHTYTKENIVDSFSHTWEDGYKYVLPWIDDAEYDISELLPGIYAKQYWDFIHQQAGYSYEWDSLTASTTQFDKMIIPYSGDKKKLNEETVEAEKVKADKLAFTQQLNLIQNNAGNTNLSFQALTINENEVDPQGYYNPANSTYTSSYTVLPPNSIDWKVRVEWELYIYNPSNFLIFPGNVAPNTEVSTPVGARPRIQIHRPGPTTGTQIAFRILNPNQFELFGSEVSGEPNLVGQPAAYRDNDGYINFKGRFFVQPLSERFVAGGFEEFVLNPSGFNLGDNLITRSLLECRVVDANYIFRQIPSVGAAKIQTEYRFRVKSISIEISPNVNNALLPGSLLDMSRFVPRKVKQSDFLKSIYQKYNLFAEIDPNNTNKIIYTSRDEFYDSGALKDWTEKLEKKIDQNLQFVPEISSKKLILSYKDDDNDPLLKSYRDETSETYGQVEVTFDNENVRGVERKDEIFSPTFNLPTDFGANLPALKSDYKFNIRFLRDGGIRNCGQYKITESTSSFVLLNTFPFVSMLDEPTNPSFDISYAEPDYYPYNVINGTSNNLYTNFWRRTLAQINSGKLLTAYFWLTEEDINKLKLNDKIKVNNALWYINAIIDYNANKKAPTKVELLSVEDDLRLPRFGRIVKPVPPGTLDPVGPIGPVRPVKPVGPIKPITWPIRDIIRIRKFEGSVIGYTGSYIDGSNIVVPDGFRGMIAADDIRANVDGIYFGNIRIDENGFFHYTRGLVIDGGQDVVYPFAKTNPVDIIDGTVDAVRNLGGFRVDRPIIDPNDIG